MSGMLSAEHIVRETLEACLPEGVPPSFRSIDKVRAIGRGKRRQIVARLTMVDGLRATVRLRQWSLGWTHRFSCMEAGPLAWEDGAWRRAGQCA